MELQWNEKTKGLVIYALKCITGWVAVILLSKLFNYTNFMWCLISVILVLSPDNSEAITLAVSRIKANLIGGLISILCLVPGTANIVTVSVAFALTIGACYWAKIESASRTALAAVIIVMLHESDVVYPHLWSVALERLLSVIAGCVLGLIITLVFHGTLRKEQAQSADTDVNEA